MCAYLLTFIGSEDYQSERSVLLFNSSQDRDCIMITLKEDDISEITKELQVVLSAKGEPVRFNQKAANVFIQDNDSKKNKNYN